MVKVVRNSTKIVCFNQCSKTEREKGSWLLKEGIHKVTPSAVDRERYVV